MMNLEQVLIRANTLIRQSEIKQLEKAYEDAFINSVIFRNNLTNELSMTREEKLQYSNLMYVVEGTKLDLKDYILKHNVISDLLYEHHSFELDI